MTLEDAIYERLTEIPGVQSEVGLKIYRGRRPQLTGKPAVTFKRVGTNPLTHATGTTNTVFARMQIDVFAGSQPTARKVADAIRGKDDNGTATGLNGWSRTDSGDPVISMVHLQNDVDLSEEEGDGRDTAVGRIMQDYLIQYSE